jgi:hypothetical protein
MRHVGIKIPADALKNSKRYAELERDVVIQICRPLRLTGAELDQLLFTNYKEIKRRKW